MTQAKRTIRTGKCLVLSALAMAIAVPLFTGEMAAQVKQTSFDLHVNRKFAACLGSPGGPTPTAHVTVTHGSLADTLSIVADNIKPGLNFDLFTIRRSNLLADGTPDPSFLNFGLAWYQTDMHANSQGQAKAYIHTILLDQIFGFDPDASLLPTNTFHVGFWFNNPSDAVACGFDPTKPTPFNGEHKAGPNAMISLPDATTDLGPLCTDPIKQGSGYVCDISK
jgi:hypothetical protein